MLAMAPHSPTTQRHSLKALLSECDHAIIRGEPEHAVAQSVADALCTGGWASAAWVGKRHSSGSLCQTLAGAGEHNLPWEQTPVVLEALLTHEAVGLMPQALTPQRPATDVQPPADEPGLVALPLCAGGQCWGVLAWRPNPDGAPFRAPARQTLQRLAQHLGHALARRSEQPLHQTAQTDVQPSQQLTQAFIDQLPGTAFLKDDRLRLVMVNRHLSAALQKPAHELVGRDNHQLFPPEFAQAADALDRAVLSEGRPQTVPQTFAGRHLETRLFVVQGWDGRRLLGGISLDVTDQHREHQRTRALLALHESAVQLDEHRLLTEGLEAVERITNSHMGFLHFVNEDQETLELITWTRNTLQGCTAAHDSHYPISSAGVWADCFRQRGPVVVNDYEALPHKHGLPAGHATLKRFVSVPVIEGDRVCMMLGVGNKDTPYTTTDVDTLQLLGNDLWRMAQRKRVEQALQQRLHELEAANTRLADMQLHLLQTEKMASIGQLAAGVAHEINNPVSFVRSNLSALAGYAQGWSRVLRCYEAAEAELGTAHTSVFAAAHAAKAETDHAFASAEIPTLIAESQDGIERVRKIVMDLKNFSRSGDTDWQWADLTEGLESTINIVWNQIKYKATLVRNYQSLPQVYCVASQINQVVMNLLVNAAQAIEQAGTITVHTGCNETDVWIEVEDTGCGMTPATQARLFEPFFTTKPPGQGTGLGLAIAWRVMQRHHGSITVQSEPGRGSRFRAQWPIDHRNSSTATP